jgi:hypothetical protein
MAYDRRAHAKRLTETFNGPHMRLLAYIDARVMTPAGPGKLSHVIDPDRVYVLLDGHDPRMPRTTRFAAEQIGTRENS